MDKFLEKTQISLGTAIALIVIIISCATMVFNIEKQTQENSKAIIAIQKNEDTNTVDKKDISKALQEINLKLGRIEGKLDSRYGD